MKNIVRDLRTRREWSQAQLADQLGVSRQTVNAIETGRYDPSLPLAFSIAKLFEKRVESIFFVDLSGVTISVVLLAASWGWKKKRARC